MIKLTQNEAELFGKRIRFLRRERGLSEGQVETLSDGKVGATYLSSMEDGRQLNVSREILERLASVFLYRARGPSASVEAGMSRLTDTALLKLFFGKTTPEEQLQMDGVTGQARRNRGESPSMPDSARGARTSVVYCQMGYASLDSELCTRCRRRFQCWFQNA